MKKVDASLVVKIAKKVIKKQGVMAFSMRDILKESGLSAGTLYRTVRNKSDVLIKIFIGCISSGNELETHIKKLPLNEKERLVVWLLYPSYLSEFRDCNFDYGVTFLGCNGSVLSHASDEAINELGEFFEENIRHSKLLMENMLQSGQIKAEQQQIESTYKQLLTVSRGIHVMASNHLLNPGRGHKVTLSNIALIELVLGQLNWGNPLTINEHNIMLALRTVSDAS
ncbi:TetR/AcrR family transcriptional regulator [Shewanella sp. 125m-7]